MIGRFSIFDTDEFESLRLLTVTRVRHMPYPSPSSPKQHHRLKTLEIVLKATDWDCFTEGCRSIMEAIQDLFPALDLLVVEWPIGKETVELQDVDEASGRWNRPS